MNKLKNINMKKMLYDGFLIILGDIIFAVGINQIITPLNLYNGGFTGIAQIIRVVLIDYLNVPEIPGIDYLGIIYFLINVPLFYMALKIIGKEFCISSFVAIALTSVCMSAIPVATKPIFDNVLAACLVGGVVVGTGAGIVLRAGSSGGGQDVIGVCISKLKPNFSVGKISIAINIGVYVICLFMFNIETVIYSFIYSTIIAMAIDRVHTQNINIRALIFTKKEGISNLIMNELHRGVTRWDGEGAYTNENTYVLCVMLSKYEQARLLEMVNRIDQQAFVLIDEGVKVYGNFDKRFNS
ncbi:MAG: YitT family protein [Clostridiales bacterium]|jgi:uncharacterized membrane-anchored protein YitT (DUF2179 family)|nr:YitT family protein [Clostridiales bacterium]